MKTDINFLRHKLMNILHYHNISISQCECRDYSYSELQILIKRYEIKLNRVNIRSNNWYRALY